MPRGITSFMRMVSKEKNREYEKAVAAGDAATAGSIFKEACLAHLKHEGDIPDSLAVEPPRNRDDRKAALVAVLNLTDARVGTGRVHDEACHAAGIEVSDGDSSLGERAKSPGLQGFITKSGHFSDGLRYFSVADDGLIDMPGIPANGDKTLDDRFSPVLPGKSPVCVFGAGLATKSLC